jgi:hypothetical protein
LDRHGWCQRNHYADETPTPAADVTGALAIVCYGAPTDTLKAHRLFMNELSDADHAFLCAVGVLGAFVGLDDMVDAEGNAVDYSLSDWNDEAYQSAGAVSAVLRAAADDYDQTWGTL